MVAIPKEVYLPDTKNSNYFRDYPDPIQRFNAVNDYHKSYLSNVKIPLCFDDDDDDTDGFPSSVRSRSSGGKVSLLDVHFQSKTTIRTVLDHFLVSSLRQNEEVWIITGSGHHVAKGHQKRESGGVLFNSVKEYLEELSELHDRNVEFRVGKDVSGGGRNSSVSGGAFLVRLKRS